MHFSSSRRRALPSVAAAMIVALVLPFSAPLAALAQDDDANAMPPDASATAAVAGTGVARIDALDGDVAIQRGDASDNLAAVANAPILGADYVTTGQDAHAEVGFDGRAAVRLGANVQIRFSRIDPQSRQMQLAAGTIDLRLFGTTDGQSTIDTPSISIEPRTAGSYRVSVDDNGETSVTVRDGRADIITPQGTQELDRGTTIVADGPASSPNVRSQPEIASDGFDAYNASRDHVYEAAVADSQYVNTNIQGVGDLNAYGRWVDDGTYGNVWIPAAVAPGWAPYRNGNWVWEDGYGWTWVAAEPWGWAPYHYGRWYFSASYHQWAWFPPPPARFAPAWSPALVGFVGFNIGAVRVGIGFGNIGWVPLAPHEAFHPWWGAHGGTTIVNNVTINNTYVNNSVHYRNMQVSNAVTSVTRENFQSGHFAQAVAVSPEQLHAFRPVAMQGALPIVPTAANLRFTQREAAPQFGERPDFANRAFAGRANVAVRTPFVEQQASVSRETRAPYGAQPAGVFDRPAAVAAPSYTRPAAAMTNGADPWSRFGENRGSAPAYSRPAAPDYAHPDYARPAAPAYSRPVAPDYAHPDYARPDYARPAYARPDYARPAYIRPQAPAYTRPASAGAYHTQAPRQDGERRDR